MKCRTCARRLDLEKLDYTVGCKHEQMEGFICLACAFEGVAYWMTNISEDDYCEEYVPQRTSNAFPTHECVKPTHECVEKQVTGKLTSVEIPTKCESEKAEKQVKGELISRQAVIDAIEKYDFNFPEYMERFVTELRDAMKEDLKDDIANLPSAEPRTGEWIYHMTEGVVETISCSQCSAWYDVTIPEQIATFNFCPNCGAKMSEEEVR